MVFRALRSMIKSGHSQTKTKQAVYRVCGKNDYLCEWSEWSLHPSPVQTPEGERWWYKTLSHWSSWIIKKHCDFLSLSLKYQVSYLDPMFTLKWGKWQNIISDHQAALWFKQWFKWFKQSALNLLYNSVFYLTSHDYFYTHANLALQLMRCIFIKIID